MSLVPSTRKTGQDNSVVHCSILDIEREATKSTNFMCCSYISPPLRMRSLCLSYSRCSMRLIRSSIGAEINTASSYNFGIMSPKSPVTAEMTKEWCFFMSESIEFKQSSYDRSTVCKCQLKNVQLLESQNVQLLELIIITFFAF